MLLNDFGFEVQEKVFPVELIDTLHIDLLELFQSMSESKFGHEQQEFWSRNNDSEEKRIKTLRLNDIDKIISISKFNCLRSFVSALIERISQDGLKYKFVSAHSFYKPSKVGIETPWHQDPAYSSENINFNNITCWIPLSDVTSKSSCLEFLNYSHKDKKIVPHTRINEKNYSALEAIVQPSKDDITTVELEKGGCVFHRSYVVHRATPNKSMNPRIALILIFSSIN